MKLTASEFISKAEGLKTSEMNVRQRLESIRSHRQSVQSAIATQQYRLQSLYLELEALESEESGDDEDGEGTDNSAEIAAVMAEISSTQESIEEYEQQDVELRSDEMEANSELRSIEQQEQETLAEIQDSAARTNQNIALISSFGGDYANVSAQATGSFQHNLGQLSQAAQILGGNVAMGESGSGGGSSKGGSVSGGGSSGGTGGGRNFYEAANNQRKTDTPSSGSMGAKGSASSSTGRNGKDLYGSGTTSEEERPKKNGGLGRKMLGTTSKTSALANLSAYMSSHNYGKNDYDVYSKDPEWEKLHKAAFPDFHQVADHELTRDEKISWVNSTVPSATKTDAERIVRSMEQYSGNGYDSIHWDKNGEMEETKDILQVFDSGKVNAYKGVIHRGLSFDSKRDLMKALSRGHGDWVEPGITSFSASETVAEDFASRKKWGLVLTCSNNKSAIPFRHMSLLSWEDEVLSPGAHRNSGWKIDMSSVRVDKVKRIVYADISEK